MPISFLVLLYIGKEIMNKFYVYFWLRENGTPYYIGKGSGNRGFISKQHSVHKPVNDHRILLQHYESEEDAFNAEKFFINYYGRFDNGTGILYNHTDGGEGPSGMICSEHTKALKRGKSPWNKGKVQPQEVKDKISKTKILQNINKSNPFLGRKHSEYSRHKISESKKIKECKRGHDFTKNDNIYIHPDGKKECKVCRDIRNTIRKIQRSNKI